MLLQVVNNDNNDHQDDDDNNNNNIVAITFTLNGNKEINITVGSKYIEPGYKVSGSDGKDYSKNVTVSGVVDTNKVGKYTIKYTLDVGSTKKELTRTIYVVSKVIPVTSIKTDKEEYSVNVNNTILLIQV